MTRGKIIQFKGMERNQLQLQARGSCDRPGPLRSAIVPERSSNRQTHDEEERDALFLRDVLKQTFSDVGSIPPTGCRDRGEHLSET